MGFGEVMQAINAASGMVEHHEDRAGAVFRPREQGEVMAGLKKSVSNFDL